MSPNPLDDNRTVRILKKAHEGKYGVLSQVVYDFSMAVALIRAAEKVEAPVIVQIFPPTLRQMGGAPFLRGLLELAHNAKVPASVHMDHAQKDEDITWTLDMAEAGTPLDSIMIDCSHADTLEENIEKTKGFVARAVKLGLATEAELGRLEGGEAGIQTAASSQLTDPDVAVHFVTETGVQILAPCIGNMHGRYLREPDFKIDILHELKKRLADLETTVCLHGTDDLKDALFQECIASGCSKINVNSWLRDPYLAEMQKGIAADIPFPETLANALDAFQAEAERHMIMYGSAGKA